MHRVRRVLTAATLAAATALTITSPANADPAPAGMSQSAHLQAAAPSCYLGSSYDFGPRVGSLSSPRGTLCLISRTSSGKLAQLIFQSDGNLALYIGSRAVWATGTQGRGHYFILQGDGNAVVYDDQGRPLWWSGTQGGLNRRIIVQSDGNLVIYKTDFQGRRIESALWATGTNGAG